jgi:hypothetical protein
LALAWDLRDTLGIAVNCERLASVAAGQGDAARAVRLLATAAALREAGGTPLRPRDQSEYHRLLATVRGQLDTDTFAAMWTEGQRMPLEQAVAYARAGTG